MVAAGSVGFMRHEDEIRSIETGRPLRDPAYPCNTLAPVTVCYALAALAATILPVQGKLAIHGPIRPLDGGFLLSLFT